MIVLDTHIWNCWVDGNDRLTEKHWEYIEDNQSQGLGVSIVYCWEVAKLVEKIDNVCCMASTLRQRP